MATLILLNKPFQVLCQFTDDQGRETLANYVATPEVYPAGRLDYDSEGLVLLTGNGQLQHRIAAPSKKMPKTYWVQVEGDIHQAALNRLADGVELKDGPTRPAQARRLEAPTVWPRTPPIRQRPNQPTSWIELTLTEGRNRQVRRMTAAVGFPTLRLIRIRIGNWSLEDLAPGESITVDVHLPVTKTPRRPTRNGAQRQRRSHQNARTQPRGASKS
ncbi:pseudouridine synthase [Marinobacter sp. SS21]|uniref:pseudouridine synthase n=1 Tax=Marinobacter sp. SS21 TaxID=2979460 RepID=UPI00232CA975|nr:pseudouridine synthase [Marinobacter sp. SS21]MDC0662031.1 pseudouridine synthase [Marinobacter sp. SS21]